MCLSQNIARILASFGAIKTQNDKDMEWEDTADNIEMGLR